MWILINYLKFSDSILVVLIIALFLCLCVKHSEYGIVTDGWSLFSHDYRLCVLLLVGNKESKYMDSSYRSVATLCTLHKNLPFRVRVTGW